MLAQKSDNPVEAYREFRKDRDSQEDAVDIGDLPPEFQGWLRTRGTA